MGNLQYITVAPTKKLGQVCRCCKFSRLLLYNTLLLEMLGQIHYIGRAFPEMGIQPPDTQIIRSFSREHTRTGSVADSYLDIGFLKQATLRCQAINIWTNHMLASIAVQLWP